MSPKAAQKSYLAATFWDRLAAMVIDELILLVPVIIAQFLFAKLLPSYSQLSFIAETVIYACYNIYLINKQGATIGKKVMKIKVVTTSYTKVTLPSVILRETAAKWISSIFLKLGYLWVLIDKNRQAWHDKLAKTYVVKTFPNGQFRPGPNPPVTEKDKVFFVIFALLWGIPFALLPLFIFFYLFIASPNQVKGSAMSPTLNNNEYILTSKISYRFTLPKRGDIIIFRSPMDSRIEYIKRIVGLPGERVTILGGKVYIEAKELNEPYLPQNTTTNIFPGSYISEGIPIILKTDNYFVLGDNREHSADSREFGPISKDNIIGVYWITYYPLTSLGRKP